MAVNLAREGMEMVYNIRDTNWREYSGLKDRYWLKADPFSIDRALVHQGLYSLDLKTQLEQQYFALSRQGNYNSFYDDLRTSSLGERAPYEVVFSGEFYFSGTSTPISELMIDGVKFYRIVNVLGLYDK